MFERNRQRGQDEDKETDHVYASEDDNGLVLSKILIGNNGTEKWSNYKFGENDSSKSLLTWTHHSTTKKRT